MTPEAAFTQNEIFEGGDKYTDNPNDPGKGTKWGFSQLAYPNVDIKNLDRATALAMYITDYWNKSSCGKLKPELQYVMVDTAFNCGVDNAIKILQEASGAEVDGVFGSETLTKSDSATIGEYLFLREVYYAKIVEHRQSQIEFLGGWTNRNTQILSLYKTGKLA